jgi:hypothetical protein
MNYPKRPIKTIIFSLSLLFLTLMFSANTLLAAETANLEKDTGPYHVILETKPENLISNETAKITIIIKNKATGEAIVGAKVIMKDPMVSKNSNMDGMDKSPGNKANGTVLHEQSDMDMEPGTYMADMTFKQAGQLDQSFSINSSLGQSTVSFPINVVESGPNFVFIGTVAGLIVIAGIIAAIIKKKNFAEIGGAL